MNYSERLKPVILSVALISMLYGCGANPYDNNGGSSGLNIANSATNTEPPVPVQTFPVDYTGLNEFQVNTTTKDHQGGSVMAMDNEGNFIVVWRTFIDGTISNCRYTLPLPVSKGLYAQKFNNQGKPVGHEFQIMLPDTFSLYSVAMAGNGEFILVSNGSEAGNKGIYIQKYQPDGTPSGDKVKISSNPRFDSLAMQPDGNFIVTWSESVPFASNVFAQRFDSNINPLGSKFMVNTFNQAGRETNDEATIGGTSCDGKPLPEKIIKGSVYLSRDSSRVAVNKNGEFVITWLSSGQVANKTNTIHAQIFNPNGSKMGEEFQVNTTSGEFEGGHDIAIGDDGSFVITWDSMSNPIIGMAEVYAQRFDSTGAKSGTQIRVSSREDGHQMFPKVKTDDSGSFVITWQGYSIQDSTDVYLQKYDKTGNKIGDELRVNDFVKTSQSHPDMIMDDKGDFIISWTSDEDSEGGQSKESNGQDGSWGGIYAKRFLKN